MAGEPHGDGKNRRAAVAACVGLSALIAFCTSGAGAQVPGIDCLQSAEASVSTIAIASRNGALGATIAVPVTISTEGPAPTTIELIIAFDDSRLSYVRSELGPAVPSSKQLEDRLFDDAVSLIILGIDIDIDPIVDGTLLNLFFRVADDAPLIATSITGGTSENTGPSSAARGEEISGLVVCFVVDVVVVPGEVTPFVGPPPLGCGAVRLGRLRRDGPFARHWGDIAVTFVSVGSLCAAGRLRRSALR